MIKENNPEKYRTWLYWPFNDLDPEEFEKFKPMLSISKRIKFVSIFFVIYGISIFYFNLISTRTFGILIGGLGGVIFWTIYAIGVRKGKIKYDNRTYKK